MIVPDRPNDLSGVLTTALGIYGQVNGQVSGTDASAVPAAPAAPRGVAPAAAPAARRPSGGLGLGPAKWDK